MYQLIRARHRLDSRSGKWRDVVLTDAPCATLATVYGDVRLYIEIPYGPEPLVSVLHWVNVLDLIQNIGPTVTVQEWLTSLGNKTLPFDSELPDETVRLVKYAQAWHCGYQIHPVGKLGHVDQTITAGHKEDLVITHPEFKPEYIRNNTLITVNGYYHLTDYTSQGVRVIEGNTTVRKCNDNQVGVYSFETIGGLTYLPITDEMISGLNADAPLWDATYITIPEKYDIKGKTVLLVTGGFLNVLSDVYTQVSDNTFRIRFRNMGFLDRYLESVNHINLDSLGLEHTSDNPSLFSVPDLKCNRVIREYLKLAQTFFVIVDAPNLFHSFEPVESLSLPNRYVDDKYERLPLVGAYGKALDYHVVREPQTIGDIPDIDYRYVYITSENKRYLYLAKTDNWTKSKLEDNGTYPAYQFRYDSAFYRLIGTED